MLIIELNGGLGNQLQQYALYEKLKYLGKEVKLDISWYENRISSEDGAVTKRALELDYFPRVSYEICTAEEKRRILGSGSFLAKAGRRLGILSNNRYTEYRMYDEEIFTLDNRVLTGYWACEAYYGDIIPLLRERLSFPPSGNPLNESIKQEMAESNSVSIHLRRGDYLTAENQKMFGGICTDAYYEAAIQAMQKQVENPRFFLFSDDPQYAEEKFSGTIIDINRGKDSFYDIELMSCCKHNICANSTFSFWGARLNPNSDKIIIRPLKQKNGVDWYQPESMKRLWKGWICIDEQGKMAP
ncbi:MAG: alpha-1,2-fucosyltransferase [Lachnospiraceae bacterium]